MKHSYALKQRNAANRDGHVWQLSANRNRKSSTEADRMVVHN